MLSEHLAHLARVVRQNPPTPQSAETLARLFETLSKDALALEARATFAPAANDPEPPRAA